jgi:hypothetical protein
MGFLAATDHGTEVSGHARSFDRWKDAVDRS